MTVWKKKGYNQKRIQQKFVIKKQGGFENDYDKRATGSTSQTDERKED